MKPLPELYRTASRFHPHVEEIAQGVQLAGEVLVLTDSRGEVAAVLPAEEYRRLKALDERERAWERVKVRLQSLPETSQP